MNFQRIFKLKGESTSEVADMIVPVVIVEPVINIIKQNTVTNATTATVYTTPADKDFYLVAIQMTTIKDVTSTNTYTYVAGVISGVGMTFFQLPCFTLTVQTLQAQLSLPLPIKLDRNTTVTVNQETNVANSKTNAVIYGYTVETINNG